MTDVPPLPPSALPPLRPEPPPRAPWRARLLLAAPHRLGFFLAMLVLVAASGWWLLVQGARAVGASAPAAAVPPTLTHAAVMVFGFMPLFFSGFLFTAGPRWLDVPAPSARALVAPLGLQAAGWLLWLLAAALPASTVPGARAGLGVALAALALALAGLAWMMALFWRLVLMSRAADRVHALAIGVGGLLGVLCLAGIAAALAADELGVALALTRTALWGFIVVTYVSVAHRMLPFFTSGALPLVALWRPGWVLALMLGVAAFEVLAVWVDLAAPASGVWPAWTLACIAFESAAGAALLWLAVAWGLAQSLKIRLLAMLHVGFVWLGLALGYSAASQALWLATGRAVLGLGALHALSMGFLGSMLLAMVTRVSCGHGGRRLVADDFVWALFWVLQLAVLVRLAAAVEGAPGALTPLAAALWALVMVPWALRYARWYGRPRIDGRPG